MFTFSVFTRSPPFIRVHNAWPCCPEAARSHWHAYRSNSGREFWVEPPLERRSHWGPDVWSRLLIAPLTALFLQWAAAGAAVVIVWGTPTVGLGCRSTSCLLYAAASALSWTLLVVSSTLTHALAPTSNHASSASRLQPHLQSFVRLPAIHPRRLGKLLATCNAFWVVVTCLLLAVLPGSWLVPAASSPSASGGRELTLDPLYLLDILLSAPNWKLPSAS
jgi:hypothetical protein